MNFFESQRGKLGLSQRAMATRLGISNTWVGKFEDDEAEPRLSIAVLAKAYDVPEGRMEKEVMALRRRIEAKRAKAEAAATK